ncbi:MAG: hypothetical protein NC252_03125 [Roseburia sp.]|nr:hypothetical protein [Roseburia sp.]
MTVEEVAKYKEDGFSGFIKVSDLRISSNIIPQSGGVYVVLRVSDDKPQFLEMGTGGHFKGKDPNVSIAELESNVIEGSSTMYIGKATSLRKRLGQLLRFGVGANIGHWGGRYLWQLADADDLLIAWKETPKTDPRTVEASMLSNYVNQYGRLPFANLAN